MADAGLRCVDTLADVTADHVALHPDGATWAAASSDRIAIGAGQNWKGHPLTGFGVRNLSFTSDGGTLLASPHRLDAGGRMLGPDADAIDASLWTGIDLAHRLPGDRQEITAADHDPTGHTLVVATELRAGRQQGIHHRRGGPRPGPRLLCLDGASGDCRSVLQEDLLGYGCVHVSSRWILAASEFIRCIARDSLQRVGMLQPDGTGIRTLAVDPDESRVVSGATNGVVSLSALESMQVLDVWQAHEDEVTFAGIVDRGREVLTASADGALKLWSCGPPVRLVASVDVGGAVRCGAVDPGGRRMLLAVTGPPDRLVVLERTSGG